MYRTVSNIRIFFAILVIILSANHIDAGQEAEIARMCQDLSSRLLCSKTCIPSSWTNQGCGPNTLYCAKERCDAGWRYQCCFYQTDTKKRDTTIRHIPSFWNFRKLQHGQGQGQRELLRNIYNNKTLTKNSDESSHSSELSSSNRKPLLPYLLPIRNGVDEDGFGYLDYNN